MFLVLASDFCCCSPSASTFDKLYIQTCSSAYLGCNKWLFVLLLPSNYLKAVWPLTSTRRFRQKNSYTLDIISFSEYYSKEPLLFKKNLAGKLNFPNLHLMRFLDQFLLYRQDHRQSSRDMWPWSFSKTKQSTDTIYKLWNTVMGRGDEVLCVPKYASMYVCIHPSISLIQFKVVDRWSLS